MTISLSGGTTASTVQSNLQTQNARQNASIARLSSGERVFRAEEDPAAIVSGVGLQTELASLGRARLNASSGIAALQIADSALSNITDIVTRLSALASQSASGQLSDEDRAITNLEFQSLKQEIDRTAQDTEFNDVKLLTGAASFTQTAGVTPSIDGVAEVQFNRAVTGDNPAIRYSYDNTAETLTATRIDTVPGVSETLDLTLLLNTVAGGGNNLGTGQTLDLTFNTLGATLTLDSAFDRTANTLPSLADNSGADIALTAPVAGNTFEPATQGITEEAVLNLTGLATNYNPANGDLTLDIQTNGTNVTLGGVAGLKFSVNGGAVGADGAASADIASGAPIFADVFVSTADGDVNIGRVNFDAVATSGTTNGTISLNVGEGLVQGTYADDSGTRELTYVVGNGISNTEDQIIVSVQAATIASLNLEASALVTQAGSDAALQDLSSALDQLSQLRANIGAQQSRLEFVARNISTTVENTTIAQSNLLDVDITQEITELTNAQTLFEASLGILGRVNQQPQQILQLLRDS